MTTSLRKTLEKMLDVAHENSGLQRGDWEWAMKEWARLKEAEKEQSNGNLT